MAQSVLGSRPVSFTCRQLISGLRVLAYHDVPDPLIFDRHLSLIRSTYRPVGADAVVAAVEHGLNLPRRAIWVTFDDGHPSALAAGAALAAAGVQATLFVCPSLVDSTEPFWWQVIDEAARRGLLPDRHNDDPGTFTNSLKSVPDLDRRAVVAAIRAALNDCATPFGVMQATSADLDTWTAAGHHVGNHTWNHPLLDTCTAPEQERQIGLAHEWIKERFRDQPRVFAYPNGNWTSHARRIASDLGYAVRALFDHRVAHRVARENEISRLRLDADASPARFRAIASGAHSVFFSALRR